MVFDWTGNGCHESGMLSINKPARLGWLDRSCVMECGRVQWVGHVWGLVCGVRQCCSSDVSWDDLEGSEWVVAIRSSVSVFTSSRHSDE